MTINLQGKTILVTRPEPAGPRLCQAVREHGGKAIFFPTISILPPDDLQALKASIEQLEDQDWLIFISPQAVLMTATLIQQHRWPLPTNIKIAAQGLGTATALKEAGFNVDCYPRTGNDSESLLALAPFVTPHNLNIAVIRGEGGRALIGKTLKERGAKILDVIAYRRELPDINTVELVNEMKENPLNAIVCSSFEGIKNLKTLVGLSGFPLIQPVLLIVMSERVKKLAEGLQFTNIAVLPSASPLALMDMIAHRGKIICQK